MTATDCRARALRTRQLGLILAVLLVAMWVAFAFLIPIAWAAVLAIAEWPLYRRAISRFPGHDGLIAALFALDHGTVYAASPNFELQDSGSTISVTCS